MLFCMSCLYIWHLKYSCKSCLNTLVHQLWLVYLHNTNCNNTNKLTHSVTWQMFHSSKKIYSLQNRLKKNLCVSFHIPRWLSLLLCQEFLLYFHVVLHISYDPHNSCLHLLTPPVILHKEPTVNLSSCTDKLIWWCLKYIDPSLF